MPADAVLDDLRKVADDRVRPAGEDDVIGGAPARFVATPTSTDGTAELLRVAAHHGLHVVARGAGTKQDWGCRPRPWTSSSTRRRSQAWSSTPPATWWPSSAPAPG